MSGFPKKLLKKLQERQQMDAFRRLPLPNDLIDFSSNDYLGFASSELLFEQTSKLLEKERLLRNGATGSRLLTGNNRFYQRTEELLKDLYKAEAALLFNSGYDANVGFFSSVPQRGDVVLYDELVHASIRDGIKMGNATAYKFSHNSLDDLERQVQRQLKARSDSEVYVVTESVFSMDGDSPDLENLVRFCTESGCQLVVDEAHALGLSGEGLGLLKTLNLTEGVFARIVTFGKALGCHGAAVLGKQALKDFLVNFARSFIYSTGLPPHSVAAISTAHQFLLSTEGAAASARLLENCRFFLEQLKVTKLEAHFIKSDAAIQSCVIPGNSRVKEIAGILEAENFDVKAVLSPTVPEGLERLRFCLHSFNKKEEIKEVLAILAAALKNT